MRRKTLYHILLHLCHNRLVPRKRSKNSTVWVLLLPFKPGRGSSQKRTQLWLSYLGGCPKPRRKLLSELRFLKPFYLLPFWCHLSSCLLSYICDVVIYLLPVTWFIDFNIIFILRSSNLIAGYFASNLRHGTEIWPIRSQQSHSYFNIVFIYYQIKR